MNTNILKSHGARQLLGACAGMFVVSVLYVGINMLPGMQVTPALLVDTNSTISENAGRVRVNDKTVDNGELARIASRAAQVAAQLHAAAGETSSAFSSASALPYVRAPQSATVVNRTDPNAWALMRQAQRELDNLYDAAPSSQSAQASVQSSSSSSAVSSPAPNYAPIQYTTPVTAISERGDELPSSGLGLNVLILAALTLSALAMSPHRRRALIAALQRAHTASR